MPRAYKAPLATVTPAPLYEREVELTEVDSLLAEVEDAAGTVLVVEGPPGIGKTEMLAATATAARAAGHDVLAGGGGEHERDFAFGVVRQLFEPVIASSSAAERARLISGAAALAAPVVDPVGASASAPPADTAAVMHGLYWLVEGLAVGRPLTLVVDDLQWADTASSRWLGYLARRLDGLSVLLALGLRRDAPGAAAGPPFLAVPGARRLTLAPLSGSATMLVLRDSLGGEVHDSLVAACHAATGGNPFFVRELSRELVASGTAPDGDAAAAVRALTPATVASAVVERLERLPAHARELARAVAVLGTRAELRHAAALAQLDPRDAASAVDALAASSLICLEPLSFLHPILRTAVYASIPAARRALDHARAGRMLAAEGSDPVRVATHLMAAAPLGDVEVVEHLRRAAGAALKAGAPAEAAAYLRRALAEPPAAKLTVAVLQELGGAELMAREPAAEEHLARAMDAADARGERAAIALLLAEAVGFAGRLADAREISTAALERLGGADAGLAVRLETQRARNDAIDRRFALGLDRRLPRLLTMAESAGPVGRALLLCLAFRLGVRGEPPGRVVVLVERGLDGERFIGEEGADNAGAVTAVAALVYVDRLDDAERLLEHMARDARARGAVMTHMAVRGWRSYIQHRRGSLAAAEADGRAALGVAEEHEQHFPGTFFRAYLAQTLIARGALDEASTLLVAPAPGDLAGTTAAATLLEARGRLALARGRCEEAVSVLRSCGELCVSLGIDNPGALPWRSLLAPALPSGSRDEALALVETDVARARRQGQTRGLGLALRAQALIDEGDRRIELLREAAGAFERSPAVLEAGLALADLGVALRHRGWVADAREPLRRALDAAERCGAGPLAERTQAELRIAGARPRRVRLTGVDALTVNERRVAAMAAEGFSNPDIAQALFVSRKTVEKHLSGAYRKLDIDSRDRLPDTLRSEPTPRARKQ